MHSFAAHGTGLDHMPSCHLLHFDQWYPTI